MIVIFYYRLSSLALYNRAQTMRRRELRPLVMILALASGIVVRAAAQETATLASAVTGLGSSIAASEAASRPLRVTPRPVDLRAEEGPLHSVRRGLRAHPVSEPTAVMGRTPQPEKRQRRHKSSPASVAHEVLTVHRFFRDVTVFGGDSVCTFRCLARTVVRDCGSGWESRFLSGLDQDATRGRRGSGPLAYVQATGRGSQTCASRFVSFSGGT